jgi:hypothetical protein
MFSFSEKGIRFSKLSDGYVSLKSEAKEVYYGYGTEYV